MSEEPSRLADADADADADTAPGASAALMPFGTLLYRFLFFDWLFDDLSSKMTLLERHAAWQHNRAMGRYLPLYLRRWAVLAGVGFLLGWTFESLLASALLAAGFFTCCCIIVTGMLLTTGLWIVLSQPDLP